jgi:hypothetical protein
LIKYRRGSQSILIYLVNKYGWEIVKQAREIAIITNYEYMLENRLLESFYMNYPFKETNKFKAIYSLFRHFLRFLILPDPYKHIYKKYL